MVVLEVQLSSSCVMQLALDVTGMSAWRVV
jgi:hypothetical protein